MLKRIVLWLAASAMMAAMVVTYAVPSFAAKGGNGGGAIVNTSDNKEGERVHSVQTPSGNENNQARSDDPDFGGIARTHSNHKGNYVAQANIPGECVSHASVTPSDQRNEFMHSKTQPPECVAKAP